jgi:hypothetical protein
MDPPLPRLRTGGLTVPIAKVLTCARSWCRQGTMAPFMLSNCIRGPGDAGGWKGNDVGHDLFFHALVLLGLLCLCRLLYWVWPRGRPTTGQTTPTPAKPIEQRSKTPKPFPGLTHKPRCEACEHAADA